MKGKIKTKKMVNYRTHKKVITYKRCLLLETKIKRSALSGRSLFLKSLQIWPAVLKRRSEAAELGGAFNHEVVLLHVQRSPIL